MGIARRGLLFGAAAVAATGTAGVGLWLAEQDRTISDEFQETARQYPIINSLRRSICRTESAVGQASLRGSAVLLDNMGTLALTAHQYAGDRMVVKFVPQPFPLLSYSTANAVRIAHDRKTDTSFWQLEDPSVIARFGLQPIQWDAINKGTFAKSQALLSIGFPGYAEGKLNAKPHELMGYLPSITAVGETVLENGTMEAHTSINTCKIQMMSPLGPGNSGGGVFKVAGGFVGIATDTGLTNSEFTPSDAIWNGYINLVPAARRYPHKPVFHKECHIP